MIDREALCTELFPHAQTEAQLEIMTNLFDMGDFFVTQFGMNAANVMTDLVKLFPQVDTLAEVVNAKFGSGYTSYLLDLIRDGEVTSIIKALAISMDKNVSEQRHAFFKNIHTLFELDQCNMKFAADYLRDYLAISSMLNSQTVFDKQMTNLENQLQAYVKKENKFQVDENADRFFLPEPTAEKPFNRQKILSGFLYQWAKKNHFDETHYAKVVGGLPQQLFFGLLNDKLFFKDDGANDEHGPWPHIIQWFMIAEQYREHAFLKHEPISLYQDLANRDYLNHGRKFFDLGTEYQGRMKPTAAWDIFFDRNAKWSQTKYPDYRIPETITGALRDDAAKNRDERKWPLLSECVARVYNKKVAQKNSGEKDKYIWPEDRIIMRDYPADNEKNEAPDSTTPLNK